MELYVSLFVVAVIRHYGYLLVEDAYMGRVSKSLGSFAAIVLVCLIYRYEQQKPFFHRIRIPVTVVTVYYLLEEMMAFLCPIWHIFKPWPVPSGMGMCSARIGFDIDALSILVVAAIMWYLTQRNHDGRQ